MFNNSPIIQKAINNYRKRKSQPSNMIGFIVEQTGLPRNVIQNYINNHS